MTTDDGIPTRQSIDAKDRSAPLKVTGRLRVALNLMVWRGLTRDQSAIEAGLKPHSLYIAFRKSHVKAAYLAELDLLRTSERARNIHALVAVRDGKIGDKTHSNPMAVVAAAAKLEQIEETGPGRPGFIQQLPGLTVVLNVNGGDTPRPVVNVTPPAPIVQHQPNMNPVFRPPAPRDPWDD